jgi:hypothetical protein
MHLERIANVKRLTILLGFAVLTFMAGLAADWGFYRIADSLYVVENGSSGTSVIRPGSEIRVKLLTLTETQDGLVGEFEVSNLGSETAYYFGYGKESHCAELISYYFTVERLSNCWCGTGLEDQSLASGETVKFEVAVKEARHPFGIGFTFEMGEERAARTFWSEHINPRVFLENQIELR